ncbi:hypothetical protein CEUSTIGMA_g8446.t1 [Chlamydomonas eustigma]|uniref:Uncharacterized protein n=1 Tax=Chlamydomonas eustigma TaxID=1157962 RepID=A0A250XD62_9CHLO|nr:hypothetical protein CEUSTIGMA_g8446.t1 [Chlamydomonas eustigma]|eukprot:GAX81011.1 hypothetical protein CEUSTIGMA_g8446.t1 [Chlamydomonas eustigma]
MWTTLLFQLPITPQLLLPVMILFLLLYSPYGLINLPLAPEEDAVTKANAATTPKSVSLVSVTKAANAATTPKSVSLVSVTKANAATTPKSVSLVSVTKATAATTPKSVSLVSVTKATAATTPKSVSLDLKASTNSLPSATAAAAFRRPVHLAGRLDSSSSNAASSAAPVVPPSGSAPVYQLRPDEVILLMGCLPPANASRYFAFTPYMYTAYDNVTSTWVNVFGSMGDSKSVIRETATCDASQDACLVSGPYAQYGLRNRLNASLPSDYAALINMSNGGRHNNAVSANGSASGSTSGATGGGSNADIGSSGLGSGGLTWWWTRWWASRQQGGKGTADQAVSSPVSNTSNGQTFFSNGKVQGKNGSSLSSTTAFGSPAAGSWSDNSRDPAASQQDQPPLMWVPQIPPSAFERFTVVVMSASQEASKNVEEVINTALKSMDIIDAVNLLPIPTTPFSNNIGLDPESPYYMLLMRNIIPQGQSPLFASYSEAKPWSAWRLTPGTLAAAAASSGTPETLLSAAGKLLGGLAFPSVSESSGGPSSADLPFPNGTVVHSTSYGTYTSFPIPKVVPRTATWLNQSESWLLPAFNYLQNRIQVRHGGGNALAWSLITDSYLAILGIDWGISCVDWLIDACNGDNRDAQYESSYPLVSLDKNSKVLWVVGVNHVATGLATYANVALLDPIQEVGLLAFDDTELPGSSDDLMQGGPFEAMAPFLFSVRFSRNCQGMSYCKTIPSQGANSLPTARPALIMMRSYVNPATGVGPNVTALIPFRTITVTPQSDAGPWDVLARNNPATLANSSCPGDLLGTTLCTASGVQVSLSSSEVF